MQGAEENLTVNVPPFNGVSQNQSIPRGLIAPYEQQRDDINKIFQSQMTIELHKQINHLEERAVSCIKSKDKALQEEKRQRGFLQESLTTAIAEIEYWKKLSDKKSIELKDKALEEEKKKCEHLKKSLRSAESEVTYWKMVADLKTKSCADLAERLVKAKKRELFMKKKEKDKYPEEAHSSTGDNGEDESDSWRGWRKRPRV